MVKVGLETGVRRALGSSGMCVVRLLQWVCRVGSGGAEAGMAAGRGSLFRGWGIQTSGPVCSWFVLFRVFEVNSL